MYSAVDSTSCLYLITTNTVETDYTKCVCIPLDSSPEVWTVDAFGRTTTSEENELWKHTRGHRGWEVTRRPRLSGGDATSGPRSKVKSILNSDGQHPLLPPRTQVQAAAGSWAAGHCSIRSRGYDGDASETACGWAMKFKSCTRA